MKKIVRGICCLIGFWCMYVMQIQATEAEVIGANVLVEVIETVDVYTEPDNRSKKIATIEEGTPMISVSMQQDAWIEVSYQQIKGFVEVKHVKIFGEAGLEDEFKKIEQANRLLITELRYVEKQEKEKLIWGIVIAVLVVAIFTVGIVSGVLKNEQGKKSRTVYKHQKH